MSFRLGSAGLARRLSTAAIPRFARAPAALEPVLKKGSKKR